MTDDLIKCNWCGDEYEESEGKYEKDMGFLCNHCIQGIESREGPLDFEESEYDYEWEENPWEEVESKTVKDEDGYSTSYTWYKAVVDGEEKHIFMFGDYEPDENYADWECETEEEAQEWFDSYNGFEDDLDESQLTETADGKDELWNQLNNNESAYMTLANIVKKGVEKGWRKEAIISAVRREIYNMRNDFGRIHTTQQERAELARDFVEDELPKDYKSIKESTKGRKEIPFVDYDTLIDGYINNMDDDDIDRELRLHNKFARALGVKADDLLVVVNTDEYAPSASSETPIKDLTKSAKLYNVGGIPLIEEKKNGLFLWFKDERDIQDYIKYMDKVLGNDDLDEAFPVAALVPIAKAALPHLIGGVAGAVAGQAITDGAQKMAQKKQPQQESAGAAIGKVATKALPYLKKAYPYLLQSLPIFAETALEVAKYKNNTAQNNQNNNANNQPKSQTNSAPKNSQGTNLNNITAEDAETLIKALEVIKKFKSQTGEEINEGLFDIFKKKNTTSKPKGSNQVEVWCIYDGETGRAVWYGWTRDDVESEWRKLPHHKQIKYKYRKEMMDEDEAIDIVYA